MAMLRSPGMTLEELAFDNQAAPNVSSWLEVSRLPSFTAIKADQVLSNALREP